MVIHPPNLYAGTGFTIPFAFALGATGALPGGEMDSPYAQMDDESRGMFQSMGILLGAHGVRRLGWAILGAGSGGECVVLPRLTGTAFLHSVMMQEKPDDEGLERVAGVLHVCACAFLERC